jgi:LytS/YehU family sensor histidine kinase
MLQPFIENSIWHGVRYLENRKGKIVVRFEGLHEKYLLCIIEDDGIGRKLSAERKSPDLMKKTSRGIKIIMERINILNSMNKSNCRILMEDLFTDKEESGTKIIIQLPVRQVF